MLVKCEIAFCKPEITLADVCIVAIWPCKNRGQARPTMPGNTKKIWWYGNYYKELYVIRRGLGWGKGVGRANAPLMKCTISVGRTTILEELTIWKFYLKSNISLTFFRDFTIKTADFEKIQPAKILAPSMKWPTQWYVLSLRNCADITDVNLLIYVH